jgi:hypothetical protein
MEKQIETTVQTTQDSERVRELLASEVVMVGGGEVIVFGN